MSHEIRAPPTSRPCAIPPSWLSPTRSADLLGHLSDEPTGVDELIGRTRLTASQVLATLSVLELKRLVRRLPGHRFVRV